ncbi:MAG: DUF503 domain-containing protein [Phycisphaerales bacterium]
MFVGVLQFELVIKQSSSLKDKRRVVRSVKDKLHREHQVAVAEVAALDSLNLAVLGLAAVSNSGAYIHSLFDRIVAKLERTPNATLAACQRDVFKGDQLPGEATDDRGDPLWDASERRDPEEPAQ